jgi:hypothetical protein
MEPKYIQKVLNELLNSYEEKMLWPMKLQDLVILFYFS